MYKTTTRILIFESNDTDTGQRKETRHVSGIAIAVSNMKRLSDALHKSPIGSYDVPPLDLCLNDRTGLDTRAAPRDDLGDIHAIFPTSDEEDSLMDTALRNGIQSRPTTLPARDRVGRLIAQGWRQRHHTRTGHSRRKGTPTYA